MENSAHEQMAQIQKRLNRIKGKLSKEFYPNPEGISYILNLDGQKVFFPTDDPYIKSWFYPRYAGGKLHEPVASNFLIRDLDSKSVFVDVGAHLGYFSTIAALRAKLVFSIEPQEFLIGRIHQVISANHFRNVTIMHAAAGGEAGFANIPKVGRPSTKIGTSENLVPMIRLDDYFHGDRLPTHIKIDTEGFEYHVLNGSRDILKSRPTLLIEIHNNMNEFGYSKEDLWDLLKSSKYKIFGAKHRNSNSNLRELDLSALKKLNNSMVICKSG